MKTTLITLLALACAAHAATMVDSIETKWIVGPNTAGNFYCGNYTLQFTLNTGYTIENSGALLAYYWGNNGAAAYGANGIYLTPIEGSDSTFTLNLACGSLSRTGKFTQFTPESPANRSTSFSTPIQIGVTYTLSVIGRNQSQTPTLTWDSGSETAASYNGNMSNGNAGHVMSGSLNYGIKVPYVEPQPSVPEPTSATLSLLSLAALACRRRRAKA